MLWIFTQPEIFDIAARKCADVKPNEEGSKEFVIIPQDIIDHENEAAALSLPKRFGMYKTQKDMPLIESVELEDPEENNDQYEPSDDDIPIFGDELDEVEDNLV